MKEASSPVASFCHIQYGGDVWFSTRGGVHPVYVLYVNDVTHMHFVLSTERSRGPIPKSSSLHSRTTSTSTCSARSTSTGPTLTRCGSGWRSSPTGEASWESKIHFHHRLQCCHLVVTSHLFSFVSFYPRSGIKWNFTKVKSHRCAGSNILATNKIKWFPACLNFKNALSWSLTWFTDVFLVTFVARFPRKG